MKVPNLERVMETFIRIPLEGTGEEIWPNYLNILRSEVAPLLKDLVQKGIVSWYSFLVHNRESGVPTKVDDPNPYIHLRMELTDISNETELREQLPPFCLWTRKMQVPDPPSLDGVDVQSLQNAQIEQGWKVLGEASEWVLEMLNCHDPNKQIPQRNVGQFLHYIENQLWAGHSIELVRRSGISML